MIVKELDEIESVFVQWSENNHINEMMGYDENGDINKFINPHELNLILIHSAEIGLRCDKIVLDVLFMNGKSFEGVKLYQTKQTDTLVKLLNSD